MGGTLVQDEEAIKRIEELIVSDRASTMLVCIPVSYTHLRAHETLANLVCRLLLEKI